MKGFIISIDALVALSFFFFAMIILASQTYHPNEPGAVYLKQITLDTVTVLEKTGRISQAIQGNTTGVEQLIEATPKLACMNLSVINSAGNVVSSTIKSDCNTTTNVGFQTSTSAIRYGGANYVVRSVSWFRKE